MDKLTVGSCFSGIGGLELGLEWTGGFETKWQIENNEYATKVLEKHWPKVKRYGDITTLNLSTLDRVDVICGGYPCQPFSIAGERQGENDSRNLWPYMRRAILSLEPSFVILENVPGHLSLGFGRVLGDLAECGYDAEWGMLSAAGVGARHLRKRVFIIAYTVSESSRMEKYTSSGQKRRNSKASQSTILRQEDRSLSSEGARTNNKDVSNSEGRRIEEYIESWNRTWRLSGRHWWDTEPDVGRVAHGIPSRVDRLRCLGNAVVPQVAQKIGEMILKYE